MEIVRVFSVAQYEKYSLDLYYPTLVASGKRRFLGIPEYKRNHSGGDWHAGRVVVPIYVLFINSCSWWQVGGFKDLFHACLGRWCNLTHIEPKRVGTTK